MAKLSLSAPLLTLALAMGTYAAIGPVADLVITDQTVAPDGFSRSAVVVNGGTPGPLIRGYKVRSFCAVIYVQVLIVVRRLSSQGDRFQINVIDNLTNHTMNKTTSIVGPCRDVTSILHMIVNVMPWPHSTGTVSSRRARPGPTARPS